MVQVLLPFLLVGCKARISDVKCYLLILIIFVSGLWKQKHSEQPFLASQLSDGTLRFIRLVTALLQPRSPSTIIIDEPEPELHPYAISLLANLIKQVSSETQIIVATQSSTLLDYFDPDDMIVIDREQECSIFKRDESSCHRRFSMLC